MTRITEMTQRYVDAKGAGFGLDFTVILDPALLGNIASTGSYSWFGAAGTIFWVDPEEDIVVVTIMQLFSSPKQFRPDLQTSTYQAITDSNH